MLRAPPPLSSREWRHVETLKRLQLLQPDKIPLDVALPRAARFKSALVLSRVHRVRPELTTRRCCDVGRGIRDSPEPARLAADSLLEGTGFEPSVPPEVISFPGVTVRC